MEHFLAQWLHPELGLPVTNFIRTAYGILLIFFLVFNLPLRKRFFISEKWDGYAQSSPVTNVTHHPALSTVLLISWFGLALMLATGYLAPWAALLNLCLCRYFFVSMRWKSLTRGLGAPGFMNYWLGAAVFLLEFTRTYTPEVFSLALFVLQMDFAFIMLSSGIYKWTAGYPHNHGMELGMVNPQWGYWWKFYREKSPQHWIFYVLNQLAWSLEVLAALLMFLPSTRFWGGVVIIASFIFILTQIRLGTLCYVVMIGGVLFFEPGSWGEYLIVNYLPGLPHATTLWFSPPPILGQGLQVLLWAYLLLLPLAHTGLYLNFYGHRRLPGPLQAVLERYTNFFGIIIWRVFSVDLTCFFIRIYQQDEQGQRTLLSRYGDWRLPRFNHVAECITITSIFTTLKYYPSNSQLFQERLLRYAKTLATAHAGALMFEYVVLEKTPTCFVAVPVAEFTVDSQVQTLQEHILDPERYASIRLPHQTSPVKECVRPGSYVPLKAKP